MQTLEFKDYELKINLKPFINIIGLPASGKTTLLKMLINQIYNYNIYLDGRNINEYSTDFKKRNIAVCFDNFNFNMDFVKEELLYYQEKCGFDTNTGFDNLDKFTKYFSIEGIINSECDTLTIYEKVLIKILSLLIIKPSILGIDNLLSYLETKEKLKIIKYAKENNIFILNVTANSEELLYGDAIIVLENHKVKAYDKTNAILSNEKLLVSAGFDLPLVLNLSKGLKYYDLLNKDYYDAKTLIEAIWN